MTAAFSGKIFRVSHHILSLFPKLQRRLWYPPLPPLLHHKDKDKDNIINTSTSQECLSSSYLCQWVISSVVWPWREWPFRLFPRSLSIRDVWWRRIFSWLHSCSCVSLKAIPLIVFKDIDCKHQGCIHKPIKGQCWLLPCSFLAMVSPPS